MEERFGLKADSAPVELDLSGITLVAPGLEGDGTWYSRRMAGESRAFTGESPELDRALAEAGLEDRHTLVIEAPTPAVVVGGGRAIGGVRDDEMLLQVPTKPGEVAFVLYIDEAGIVSFHYREDAPARAPALPSRAAGGATLERFRISLRRGQSKRPGETRGLFSRLVAKILKIVVVKLFPDQIGSFVARRVKAWEDAHRAAQGLHDGNWDRLLDPMPTPLADLDRLQGRRSLLLIHGTTSSTAGAFKELQRFPDLLKRLSNAYEGRVIGFNHHTMSASVAENVRQFYAALASNPGEYTFDIVCHSRGGLVARALTQLSDSTCGTFLGTAWQRPADVRVNVDRIVFVATPNAGTQLAEPERLPAFVERLTNYVTMLPDSALTLASGALMSIAGSIAEVGLPRLPGLADQAPNSMLLRSLAPPDGVSDRYFGFRANYSASGDLVDVVKDKVMDRIFERIENDLVVPTTGVSTTTSFDLPVTRVVSFGTHRGVHHTNFFTQPEMSKLAEFLGAR